MGDCQPCSIFTGSIIYVKREGLTEECHAEYEGLSFICLLVNDQIHYLK